MRPVEVRVVLALAEVVVPLGAGVRVGGLAPPAIAQPAGQQQVDSERAPLADVSREVARAVDGDDQIVEILVVQLRTEAQIVGEVAAETEHDLRRALAVEPGVGRIRGQLEKTRRLVEQTRGEVELRLGADLDARGEARRPHALAGEAVVVQPRARCQRPAPAAAEAVLGVGGRPDLVATERGVDLLGLQHDVLPVRVGAEVVPVVDVADPVAVEPDVVVDVDPAEPDPGRERTAVCADPAVVGPPAQLGLGFL